MKTEHLILDDWACDCTLGGEAVGVERFAGGSREEVIEKAQRWVDEMNAPAVDDDSPVSIAEVGGVAELYRRYDGQTSPQPCYIELDCGAGSMTADYDHEIGGGVPFSVFHGRTLRWRIPCLRAAAANALMDRLRPLAERVVAGYSTEWDGSNNVGRITGDAQDAHDEIYRICEDRMKAADEDELVSVWNAYSWLTADGANPIEEVAEDLGIKADSTDDDLAAAAEKAVSDARADGVDVLEDIDEAVERIRDKIAEAAE